MSLGIALPAVAEPPPRLGTSYLEPGKRVREACVSVLTVELRRMGSGEVFIDSAQVGYHTQHVPRFGEMIEIVVENEAALVPVSDVLWRNSMTMPWCVCRIRCDDDQWAAIKRAFGEEPPTPKDDVATRREASAEGATKENAEPPVSSEE